jgi:hypothetical protein
MIDASNEGRREATLKSESKYLLGTSSLGQQQHVTKISWK